MPFCTGDRQPPEKMLPWTQAAADDLHSKLRESCKHAVTSQKLSQ